MGPDPGPFPTAARVLHVGDACFDEAPLILRRNDVVLRPLRPQDYDGLYEIVTVAEGGLFERFHGQTPSPEDFVKALWAGVLVQFVPESGKKPIGLLVAHTANLHDGVCYITRVAYEQFPDRLHLTAIRQFAEYLFSNWELRKIYIEVSDRQRATFLRRGGQLFTEEGRLRGHEFFQGTYWDRYVYALRRSNWEADVGS